MNVESGYKPIFANKTNARVRLVEAGQRATFGSVGTAYNPDDAVPYDQVLSLLAGAGLGDMLAAIYDPSGQSTDIFDINNILIGNNISTQQLIFDSGGGQQAQLSDGQLLVGSGPGTASMSSDGTIYSSDNGSGGPEHRTEIQFDDFLMTVAGITRVHITPNSTAFSDGASQNIIFDPVSTLSMQITDGSVSSTLSRDLLVFDNAGATQMVISSVAINDGGLGGGIDFSATTGIMLLPNQGFQFLSPEDTFYFDGANVIISAKNGIVKFQNSTGRNNCGIQTDVGIMASAGVWKLGAPGGGGPPLVLDTANYIEVQIADVVYKLALAV